MGDGIFYKGSLIASEYTRVLKDGMRKGEQHIYVFEGVEALEEIMKAPNVESVQRGHWDPNDDRGKIPVGHFKNLLNQSLAIYLSLESQLANEKDR